MAVSTLDITGTVALAPLTRSTTAAPFLAIHLTDFLGSSAIATVTITPQGILDAAYGQPTNKTFTVPGSVKITDPNKALDGSTIDPMTGAITLTGPIASLQNDIQNLEVIIASAGVVDQVHFVIDAKDGFGGAAQLTGNTVYTVEPPTPNTLTISGAQAGQEVGNVSGPIKPFATVTIADPDPSGQVTVNISGGAFINTFENSGSVSVARQFSAGAPALLDPNAATDGSTTSGGFTVTGTAAFVTQVVRALQLPSLAANGEDHFTITAKDTLGGSVIDSTTALYPGSSSPSATYRFFDKTFGTHFFTASSTERDTILNSRPDLIEETNDFGSVSYGSVGSEQVYRFFDTVHGTHFFTASSTERDTILHTRPDLTFEAQASFYEHATQQTGDVAVYRFFDTNLGTHFYTGDATEEKNITTPGGNGYRPDLKYEGIEFYAPAGSYR